MERLTGKSAKWYPTQEGDYVLLTVEPDIQVSCFFNYSTPVGPLTLLSRGAHGVNLFRKIASVLGGFLQENDYDETFSMIDGNISEGNALPYFLRYAIIEDGIAPDSLDGLKKSMAKWYDRVNPANKPKYLLKK